MKAADVNTHKNQPGSAGAVVVVVAVTVVAVPVVTVVVVVAVMVVAVTVVTVEVLVVEVEVVVVSVVVTGSASRMKLYATAAASSPMASIASSPAVPSAVPTSPKYLQRYPFVAFFKKKPAHLYKTKHSSAQSWTASACDKLSSSNRSFPMQSAPSSHS
jgi:hypothetical protein